MNRHTTSFWMPRLAMLVFALFLTGRSASAQITASDTWTITLLPNSLGVISGTPGSSIGWGYFIQNNSPTYWLLVYDFQGDTPISYATVDVTPFNNLIAVAPLSNSDSAPNIGSTQIVDANGNITYRPGVANLTWDVSAPVGYSVSGIFTFSGSWYNDNPLTTGNFVDDAAPATAPYTAMVIAPTSEAPEQTSLLLLVSALGATTIFRKIRRRRS